MRSQSRNVKDQLKAELEAGAFDYNMKVAKYRLASLIEFTESTGINFDDVLDTVLDEIKTVKSPIITRK